MAGIQRPQLPLQCMPVPPNARPMAASNSEQSPAYISGDTMIRLSTLKPIPLPARELANPCPGRARADPIRLLCVQDDGQRDRRVLGATPPS